ncbi:LytR C-terminal domain-containing protein, partial [Candidatus Gottesmanbacteria bacterium]|nr:LytR C-terminal domain-containing protein [Candidatus Gottesmanbacteria bacterium]
FTTLPWTISPTSNGKKYLYIVSQIQSNDPSLDYVPNLIATFIKRELESANGSTSLAAGGSSEKVTPTPSLTEAPTNTPAPTSIVDDLSLYDITVLNGSGISGEAASLESTLQTAGFSVLEIGNAANSSFTTTIIQAKEGVPSGFIGQLQEILSKTYAVSLSSVPLAENEDTDVIITIGSLEASSASTSATPTP